MMKPSIDMVCFNRECIKKGNQLFIYESQQRECHRNHSDDDCVNIHPHNFKRKYVNQSQIIQDFRDKFESSLQINVKQAIKSISCKLKEILNRQVMKAYDRSMQQLEASNCQNLLEKIKTNNNIQYELMILNNLFLNNKEGIMKIVKKKVEKCRQEALINLQSTSKYLNHQLQKLIPQFQPQNHGIFEQPNKEVLSTLIPEPVKLQFEEMPQFEEKEDYSNKMMPQPNNPDKQNQNKNIQNKNLSINFSQQIKNTKTKQIKRLNNFQKIDRMMNLFSNNPSHKLGKLSFMSKSSCKEDTFIIRSQLDLAFMEQNPSNSQKLIIYHYLEEQQLVKIIKKKSPKQIFINFPHKLGSSFIRNIPESILMQIQKFQEFWDHDEFFDERLNRQFFPIDDFRHIKSVNKIHLTSKNLNNLSKLTNIWISNNFDLEQLKLSTKKVSSIKSLRIQVCKCCNNLNQNVISEILLYFKQGDSLKTFVLKCQKLNTNNLLLLRQLTQKNNKIQCISVEIETKMIPYQVIQSFSHLPLTKLAINNERCNKKCNVYMDITPITRMKSLKKLALMNIFFSTKQPTQEELQSNHYIQLDQLASNKISSLPNLVLIDLYRCSPIYNTVVSRLSEQSQSNLYYLNLSYTCMDESLISQLYNLPKLKMLNLDRTNLALKKLFKELSKLPLQNIQKLSLFQYNGDNLDDVDQIGGFASQIEFSEIRDQQIQKISICFPNLEYLNIGSTNIIQHFADNLLICLSPNSRSLSTCAAINNTCHLQEFNNSSIKEVFKSIFMMVSILQNILIGAFLKYKRNE